MRALRQVSTKPRYGVGLNDELGAKEAGEGEVTASGTKDRSRDDEARQANCPPDLTEVTASGANVTAVSRPLIPKTTSATRVMLERA